MGGRTIPRASVSELWTIANGGSGLRLLFPEETVEGLRERIHREGRIEFEMAREPPVASLWPPEEGRPRPGSPSPRSALLSHRPVTLPDLPPLALRWPVRYSVRYFRPKRHPKIAPGLSL